MGRKRKQNSPGNDETPKKHRSESVDESKEVKLPMVDEGVDESKLPRIGHRQTFHQPDWIEHPSAVGRGGRRVFPNLAKLLEAEDPKALNYLSISVPPSYAPGQRYSDLSGRVARYIEPYTRLHYADSEEYQYITKSLNRETVQEYLRLRGTSNAKIE